MISIYVNDSQLVLGRNTTLTVEFNNALFANPDVEGDISFTFSLPVEGNERLLRFPNMPQCGGARKMPCTVYCNGNFSWNGQLVVQKASFNTLSAALIINPYPEGFGKRKLTENEDDEIVISDSLSAHDTAWAQFLAATILDTDVKFAPFFNADGYGSDNDNWGLWNGRSRRKVVNELFLDVNGNMIDNDTLPFSKAHNGVFNLWEVDGDDSESDETSNSDYTETNQLAFCPQIRIARVLDLWCRNAGYTFINHLGGDLNLTFLQSQRSLDGTVAQYADSSGTTAVRGDSGEIDLTAWNYSGIKVPMFPADQDSAAWISYGQINLPASGWWEFVVTTGVVVKSSWGEIYSDWTKYVRIEIYLTDGHYLYEDLIEGTGVIHQWRHVLMDVETEGNKRKSHAKMKDTSMISLSGVNTTGLCFSVRAYHINTNETFKIESLRLNVTAMNVSVDQHQTGFNIFRRQFRIAETLPEVTNAAFLKTMLETMGLCYFVSGKTKRVEIVPYAMLRNAGSIDLTDWELTRETEIQSPEETLQTFRLKPLKDESYNEDLRLSDTSGNHLPDAYANHEHLTLLTKTNTLYRASMQEHEDMNWVEAWEEYSGNPDKLKTGNGEIQNREPSVCIPHQRFVGGGRVHPETDTATGETPQLMVADFTISSDIYNISEKPSDLILTQYRGLRKRAYISTATDGYVWNEVMLPVWNNEFSLRAKGENSLGEKYIKPVLELLGHKTITYKLRLPANMMQPVEDLLRPSELEPERQTRFIVIRNVKTVPKKITFQINNDSDDTVLCQIEAVKVY